MEKKSLEKDDNEKRADMNKLIIHKRIITGRKLSRFLLFLVWGF